MLRFLPRQITLYKTVREWDESEREHCVEVEEVEFDTREFVRAFVSLQNKALEIEVMGR